MRNVIICLSALLVAMTIVTCVAVEQREVAVERYWPSVREMQEWSGCKVDGIWGDETELKYKKAQERWYCDYMYSQSMRGGTDGLQKD